MKRLILALTVLAFANAQYGPIKKGPKKTTTPFPPQEPDYDPDINSVGPEENSAALSGSYNRPQSPGGAAAYPDNPWLNGIISQNPAPPPGSSRPPSPSYGSAPAPAPAYQPAPAPAYQPAPAPAYQPAPAPAYQPAPAPAYQPAPAPAYRPPPTVACNAPGYVCAPKQQCQGGVTTSSGTGSSQCDANSQVCCQKQAPQPTYQPQPQPYRPAPAPAPAPAYRPQPTYQQPAYQPSQPSQRPYQPATPIGGSIYDSQPPPSQSRPVPNYGSNPLPSYVTEQPIQRYTGPLNTTPHPGCAAALKCVEEIYCTWDGIMSDSPQSFTREQTDNKVPLSDCQNIETGIIGKCCRDPNYKDPWPAGMMMNSGPFDDGQYHPGVQHNGDVPQQQTYVQPQQPSYVQQQPQPSYVQQQPQPNYVQQQPQPNYIQQQPIPQPQQPNYVQQQPIPQPQQPNYVQQPQPSFNSRPSGIVREPCGTSSVCAPPNQCPGDRQTQPGKACRVPNDDSTGVCCSNRYPPRTNNQQFSPPKPQTNPYGAPKPKPKPVTYNAPTPQQSSRPQPNPYSAPSPQPNPAPQPSYNAPAPQQPIGYSAPAPKPATRPQPAPQPQPYSPPAIQQPSRPQPNNYGAQPALAPVPLPFPTQPPKPQQVPFNVPAPKPQSYPAPQQPQNSFIATPAPTTAAPSKPEASNAIAPEQEEPIVTSTSQPSFTTSPPLIAGSRSSVIQPPKECGVRRQVPRPNGPAGLDTGFGEFPWQAQVTRSADQSPLCSGVILAENIVLTSAQCVENLDASTVSIKAGDWKLDSEDASEEPKPVQVQKVAAIAIHPKFEPITRVFDMAVLILESSLTFDQNVDKLCLGKDSAPGQPPSGKNCVVTGWGKNQLRGNVQGSVLHSIPVSFMPNQQCQEAFRKTLLGKYFQLHDSFTCALPSSPNHDLCEVDVGSPIACQKPDGNYELSGVYSWDVGCHPNTNVPAAMAKLDNKWVSSVMNKPTEEVQKEAENEKQRQEALGQSQASEQSSKPGFNQGYGK